MKARRWTKAIALSLIVAATAGTSYAASSSDRDQPPCAAATGPAPPVTSTTIGTIEQAYYCIFDHYFSGSTMDDRSLLTAAFAGLTQELQRRGLDQADASMPPINGDRDSDWEAFSAGYERVTNKASADPDVRQALAAATMNAMVASLGDNHARWAWSMLPPDAKPGDTYGLGLSGLSGKQGSGTDPAATPPLFVTSVAAQSPAAQADLRPGDVITAVNGVPPYADGVLSQGVLRWINQTYPQNQTVRLTLHRPAGGRTWTVAIKPALYPTSAPAVTTKLLPGNVVYVTLPAFFDGAADQVIQAITKLGESRTPRGVVLDLRGNRGGSPIEVNRLLGAFVHDKITAYHCLADGSCTANRTDDTVALLNLPLVTLTDRACGSACDHFSSAVKALHVGPLVGTRTAGAVSGPAAGYQLSDNSLLLLPTLHHLGPNREIIDGIGVPPDYFVPQTAADLSKGDDRAIATALTLFP